MTDSASFVRHWKRDGADVYIGRPGPWGNPFEIGKHGDRATVIARYKAWIEAQPHLMRLARRELRGKTLGCWCAPEACHGDVLAQIANTYGEDEPCFVFGSNLRGVHGACAALFAQQHRMARRGVGSGFTGNAYAIPTKDYQIESLSLARVKEGIAKFLEDAAGRPGTMFEVTRIGCGLAGFKDATIAPLFFDAGPNVVLPYAWQRMRDPSLPPRVIVAGSRGFTDQGVLDAALDHLLQAIRDPVPVSGGAEGADALGEHYAMARFSDCAVPFLRFPAEWKRYGKQAGFIRNQQMSWAASHLVAFWDGQSPGTRAMIELAQDEGLPTRVIRTDRSAKVAAA